MSVCLDTDSIKRSKMDNTASYELNNESNLPYLRELAGQKGTFIEKITDTMHIGLLPSTLGKLKSGILDNLNSMLRKYDSQLDGILVGYDNLAMLGSTGHMIPGYHHIHINIRADFYVFKPAVGGTLTGTVLKKSGSNVTCLTNRVFTVFVSFPPRLKHCLQRVQLHQEIAFTIEKVDLLSQIPFVKGVLNEDSLGSVSRSSSPAGSHVRFSSPEPESGAEPDSGLSSIEEGSSQGPSPAGASTSGDAPDPPRPGKQRARRDREAVTVKVEPESRKAKKRRREEAEVVVKVEVESEAEAEIETSPKRAKKRHRGEPEPAAKELYLADPVLPVSSSHKKRKRRERLELNGSISGMLR